MRRSCACKECARVGRTMNHAFKCWEDGAEAEPIEIRAMRTERMLMRLFCGRECEIRESDVGLTPLLALAAQVLQHSSPISHQLHQPPLAAKKQ